jgi:hypothetical protein
MASGLRLCPRTRALLRAPLPRNEPIGARRVL